MPTKLALHKISIPRGLRKIKKPKIKKPKKLSEMDVSVFVLKKITTHWLERLQNRCPLTERQIAIDIKNWLKTTHYCAIHKDIRIIGKRFTYHFGSITWNLITLYPTNKDERKLRSKQHQRIAKSPEDIRHIFAEGS